MIEVLLAVVGAALSVCRTLPQFLQIVRTRNAAGVSSTSLSVGLVSAAAWAVYCFSSVLLAAGIAAVAAGVQYALTLVAARQHGGARADVQPYLLIGFLLVVHLVWGMPVLGLVLAASSIATGAPQLLHAFRASDLSGVSSGAWLVATLEGLLWLVVAAVVRDLPLLRWAGGQTMVSVPILWKVLAGSPGSLTVRARPDVTCTPQGVSSLGRDLARQLRKLERPVVASGPRLTV